MLQASMGKLIQEQVNPKTVQLSVVILEKKNHFTSDACFHVDISKLTTNKSENRSRISAANNGKQMNPGIQIKKTGFACPHILPFFPLKKFS